MSDAHNQTHSKSAIEQIVKYLNERLAELRSEGFSEADLADIVGSIDQVKECMNEVAHGLKPFTPEQSEMIEFAHRLMARQGTRMPDFAQLYRKKAELDETMRRHES
jgi:hypothetical protein